MNFLVYASWNIPNFKVKSLSGTSMSPWGSNTTPQGDMEANNPSVIMKILNFNFQNEKCKIFKSIYWTKLVEIFIGTKILYGQLGEIFHLSTFITSWGICTPRGVLKVFKYCLFKRYNSRFIFADFGRFQIFWIFTLYYREVTLLLLLLLHKDTFAYFWRYKDIHRNL